MNNGNWICFPRLKGEKFKEILKETPQSELLIHAANGLESSIKDRSSANRKDAALFLQYLAKQKSRAFLKKCSEDYPSTSFFCVAVSTFLISRFYPKSYSQKDKIFYGSLCIAGATFCMLIDSLIKDDLYSI